MSQQILQEDPLPHFIPKWTKHVKKQLKDPYISSLPKNTLHQKKTIATRVTNNIEIKTERNQQELNYSSHGSCLVGEANLFSDSYNDGTYDKNCDRCSTLSGQQAFLATISARNMYKFKEKLYKHIKEDHTKLYKHWEGKR